MAKRVGGMGEQCPGARELKGGPERQREKGEKEDKEKKREGRGGAGRGGAGRGPGKSVVHRSRMYSLRHWIVVVNCIRFANYFSMIVDICIGFIINKPLLLINDIGQTICTINHLVESVSRRS